MKSLLAITLSGLCLGFSQPIIGGHNLLGLISLIGYAPLIHLLRGTSVTKAFKHAFFTSLIHFIIVFYWIVIPLYFFSNFSLLSSLILLAALSIFLSCYIALAFVVAQFLHLHLGFPHYFIVPTAVCAVEYLRNYVPFGGFPWGNIGYGISQISVVLQTASLVGVYGLVFLVVMANALIANFYGARFDDLKIPKREILLFVSIILLPLVFGAYRLNTQAGQAGRVIRVGLLQANIDQGSKNEIEQHMRQSGDVFANLQDTAVAQRADVVVWPESSTPEMLFGPIGRLYKYGSAAATSIIGAVIFDDLGAHNSAVVIDSNSQAIATYHKAHLVPFGEYVPWPFQGVAQRIVPGKGIFIPGVEHKTVPGQLADGTQIRLGLTICFEGIFPEITRALTMDGADLLVNLSNDAWYKKSSAPYQHMHMYRVRAVETGLPFVRTANTGISAVIDSLGRVHHETNLNERVVRVVEVPLEKRKPVYILVGDIVPQLSLGFVLAALALHITFSRWKSKSNPSKEEG